jgi:hypothetical protein
MKKLTNKKIIKVLTKDLNILHKIMNYSLHNDNCCFWNQQKYLGESVLDFNKLLNLRVSIFNKLSNLKENLEPKKE